MRLGRAILTEMCTQDVRIDRGPVEQCETTPGIWCIAKIGARHQMTALANNHKREGEEQASLGFI